MLCGVTMFISWCLQFPRVHLFLKFSSPRQILIVNLKISSSVTVFVGGRRTYTPFFLLSTGSPEEEMAHKGATRTRQAGSSSSSSEILVCVCLCLACRKVLWSWRYTYSSQEPCYTLYFQDIINCNILHTTVPYLNAGTSFLLQKQWEE